MAHSNYKVLTDVDLSNNQLLNVSRIENTEEASKSLYIKTSGNTTLEVANLTGNVATGKTSLTTKNSEVTVTGTAIETITTSKTTTVATSTTETIDSTGINIETPSQTVVATASSKVESPGITLVTGTPEGTGTNKQAKISLTKKANTDNSKVDISAKTVAVDATDTITQTAPASVYKSNDNNSLTLDTSSVELKSTNEKITLDSSKTTVSGTRFEIKTPTVDVNNSTTTITSSTKIESKVGVTTETLTPESASLSSKNVSLTATESKNTSSIEATPSSLALNTSGTFSASSKTGAAIEDKKSIGLTAPAITGTASDSANIYSGKINLQNTKTSPTEKIVLDNGAHNIAATAGSASVSITGNNANTVVVNGAEFKVSSSKSTFDNNSTFSKNVNIVGDLTTRDMTGEAAKLNSLDVKATTTVGGNLTTSGNVQLASINGADATLESLLTVDGTTDVHGNATVGEFKVADGKTLTANNGATSTGAVSVKGTTTVNGTATVGILKVADGKTLTASNGMTSTGAVSVGGTTGVTANANVGALTVPAGETLTANDGLTSTGIVSVGGTTNVSGNTSTGTLTVRSAAGRSGC